MDETIKIVHSIGMSIAGLTIMTIMIYRAGRAFMDKVWMPIQDRMIDFLDKLEAAFDRTRERDRGSDSWRRKTAERIAETEEQVKEIREKCDRLVNHLLPARPTATIPKKPDQPGAP